MAIRVEGKIEYLAEVKAAGMTLNDNHLRQAVNYGVHEGIDWVILTNAIEWKIHKVKFTQPVDHEEVYSFNMAELSARSHDDLNKIFMLCRESVSLDSLTEYHRQAQIMNRFVIAELVQSVNVVATIRREFKRLFPTVKVTDDAISMLLANGVLKRDTLDGEPPKEAKLLIKKALSASARKAAKTAKLQTT